MHLCKTLLYVRVLPTGLAICRWVLFIIPKMTFVTQDTDKMVDVPIKQCRINQSVNNDKTYCNNEKWNNFLPGLWSVMERFFPLKRKAKGMPLLMSVNAPVLCRLKGSESFEMMKKNWSVCRGWAIWPKYHITICFTFLTVFGGLLCFLIIKVLHLLYELCMTLEWQHIHSTWF